MFSKYKLYTSFNRKNIRYYLDNFFIENIKTNDALDSFCKELFVM